MNTTEQLLGLKNERFHAKQIRHIEIDLDVIAVYAERYLKTVHEHETLDDYCDQIAADWMEPKMSKWVRAEILRQGRRAAA